jgi:hypothetical protein
MHTMEMATQSRKEGAMAFAQSKALVWALGAALGLGLWLPPGAVQAGSGLGPVVTVATAGQGIAAPFSALGEVHIAATTQSKRKSTTKTKVKRTSQKKSAATAPPERTASGETVANRERRLTRECKGRPNAGACLGFAN